MLLINITFQCLVNFVEILIIKSCFFNCSPHTPSPTIDGVQNADLNHQIGFNDDNHLPKPIETFVSTNSNVHKTPLHSVLPDTVEPDLVLLKEILEGKNNDPLEIDEIVVNGGHSSPTKQTSAHSEPQPVQLNHDTYGECGSLIVI